MKHKKNGFSLVELMVTLLIAGILLAYGVPAYNEFGKRQRITTEANDLLGDLKYARVTAIKLGRPVLVKSNSGTDWSDGWVIELTAPGSTLRVKQEINEGVELDGSEMEVTFSNIGTASVNFDIEVSHYNVSETVTLDIALSGMISSH